MLFEWDENKNRINKARHGVSFDAAKLIFFDPCLKVLFDRCENGEDRWHAIGKIQGVVMLLVVHTVQYEQTTEIIRIVSARRPTRQERKQYEE